MPLTKVRGTGLSNALTFDSGLELKSLGADFISDSYQIVKIQTDNNDDGSNDDAILQFTNGSSKTVRGEIRYDESESMFEIGQGDNQGHVRINANGNVLKPSQPFFYARPTASGDGQTRDPYKFENVIHNVGNHFVTSGTGAYERFVAPVTGRYMFTSMAGYLQGGNNFAIRFLINGSILAEPVRFIQGSAASHCAFTCSIVVQLQANDYVTLSSSGFTYHINTTYTFFSGTLLG